LLYWKFHTSREVREKNLQNLDTIMQTCPSLIFILIQDAISILFYLADLLGLEKYYA
jgi:hypothetical protein